METKTKTIEKVSKPEATATHGVAGTHQRAFATPQLSSAIGVQSAAGNLAVQRMFRSGMLQTKLAVGSPNDPLEDEADHVAEQVVHTKAEPCNCGGSCAECQSGKEGMVQRKLTPHSSSATKTDRAVSDSFRGQLGSGNALDSVTRSFFESRFSSDFSDVRVHTGEQAASSAQAINARAYTVGKDVVFGAGQYNPGMTEGKRLLAHELTHVVQQAGTSASPNRLVSEPSDTAEVEALVTSEQLIQSVGSSIPKSKAAATALIHRDGSTQPTPSSSTPVSTAANAVTPPPLSPPAPQGETYTFNGVQLAENEPFLRYQMEQLVKQGGRVAPKAFLDSFEQFYAKDDLAAARKFRSDFQKGDVSGGAPLSQEEFDKYDKEKQRLLKILNPLRHVVQVLDEENGKFLNDFEEQGKNVIREMLKESEIKINAERIKYGITSQQIQQIHVFRGGVYTTAHTKYEMDQSSSSSKSLAAAAALLIQRRNELEKLRSDQEEHVFSVSNTDKDNTIEVDAEYHRLGEQISVKLREYDILRAEMQRRFPILASFTSESETTKLQQLAQGPTPLAAAVIGQEIDDKLANITMVRDELKPGGGVQIWKLSSIVERTQIAMGIQPESMQAKLVQDQVSVIQISEAANSIIMSVVSLLLYALAPFTEGLTLIPAAAISTVSAVQHFQEYQLQNAMNQTDFDKAKVISQEEPSLFWLAMDIVGAAFDIGSAAGMLLKAFRALAPLVDTVKIARTAEESEKAIAAVEAAARANGGERLAQTVLGDVKQLKEADPLEKILAAGGKDAEVLERAAKIGDVEVLDAIGNDVKTVSGEIKLSKAGHIYSCGSPCTMLREKYAEALAKDKNLEERLLALEKRASEAAKDSETGLTAAERAKAKATAEEVKIKAAELENILRKVSTLDRTKNLKEGLKALSQKYPVLQDLPLDAEAAERVIAKGPRVDQMKGQLLEELLESKVRNMTTSEKAMLAGEKANTELEFFAGHEITDMQGAALTDGILVKRNGDKLELSSFFESKAGPTAKKGLTSEYTSFADLSDKELENLRNTAVDELKKRYPELKTIASDTIKEQYKTEVDAIVRGLPRSESGQIRKSIERLIPNEGETTIRLKINGVETEVLVSSRVSKTKAVGVLPSDVKSGRLGKTLKAEGLNYKDFSIGIKTKELESLAEDIAKAAVTTTGAPKP